MKGESAQYTTYNRNTGIEHKTRLNAERKFFLKTGIGRELLKKLIEDL